MSIIVSEIPLKVYAGMPHGFFQAFLLLFFFKFRIYSDFGYFQIKFLRFLQRFLRVKGVRWGVVKEIVQ